MRNRLNLLTSFLALAATLWATGCSKEKKIDLIPVGETVEYRDPGFGFRLKYPKEWVSATEIGRARFYSAEEVDKKFLDPTGPYPNGAMIAIDVIKTSTPDEDRDKKIAEMKSIGMMVSPAETLTVAAHPATRVPYTAHYSATVETRGEHIYLSLDTVLYDIEFSGFGDLYPANKYAFETALNSFELPKPVVKGRDETLTSESFATNENKFFSFEYPDNFNFTNPPAGKNDLVVGLRGVRQDCNIVFDVFGAQGLTVQKVFDQNKGKYRGATTGKTTVAGQETYYLTYSATKDVERKVYFLVHNDKVLRIIMDYYKPQREDYVTAYDTVLKSIKLK